MMQLKNFFKKHSLPVILTMTGAVGGFLYWKLVGCNSGTCPIQSVWYWSTLWGAAVGYLAGDFIRDLLKKRKKKTDQKE